MTEPKKNIAKILSLHAITFLHPGTGQTTGVVDLPVQREVHSGHPMYASSGLKGSLRDKAEQLWEKGDSRVVTLFGSEAGNEQGRTTAGAVAVTDGRILAFPVRSLRKVFFWVTCPMVLSRLKRDAGLIGIKLDDLHDTAMQPTEDQALVHPDSGMTEEDKLVLEEMMLQAKPAEVVKIIAKIIDEISGKCGFAAERLAIISNEDFSYFVEHATQVSARIKLNKRKTTTGDGGSLWYEETLPPETILYGFVLCHKPRTETEEMADAEKVLETLEELCRDHYLQIGGNETVGQGWCHLNLYGEV